MLKFYNKISHDYSLEMQELLKRVVQKFISPTPQDKTRGQQLQYYQSNINRVIIIMITIATKIASDFRYSTP